MLYIETHPSWDYREYELDLNHTLGTDRKIRTAKHKIVPTLQVSSTHTPFVDSTGSRQYGYKVCDHIHCLSREMKTPGQGGKLYRCAKNVMFIFAFVKMGNGG